MAKKEKKTTHAHKKANDNARRVEQGEKQSKKNDYIEIQSGDFKLFHGQFGGIKESSLNLALYINFHFFFFWVIIMTGIKVEQLVPASVYAFDGLFYSIATLTTNDFFVYLQKKIDLILVTRLFKNIFD